MSLVEIQVDGASRGNPGISGAGVVIKHNNAIFEYSFPLGVVSNHEAEFLSVIKALEICKEKYPNHMLAFQTDSQVVVNAIENNYVKNPLFKPLLAKIDLLSSNFSYLFIKWIPSEQNRHADKLAKEAIQSQLH
ncbi:MAG TPA: ribonuclease HI family protein [Pseudogracilibacillus sp.]|nr:ribonuclease HI family protein [Pseudogracilibacillus sp.]